MVDDAGVGLDPLNRTRGWVRRASMLPGTARGGGAAELGGSPDSSCAGVLSREVKEKGIDQETVV
jgi:hypothetical protein